MTRPARIHPGRERGGFTLIEMFLAVAVLMMVLGLAINLAKHGRTQSQAGQTRTSLRGLAAALEGYRSAHAGRGPTAPPVLPAIASADASVKLDEAELYRAAEANDAAVVRQLVPYWPRTGPAAGLLSGRLFDGVVLRDTWGSPIAYLPSQHPALGMAADDRPFFVSPGPDRRFLTRDDNLYSYEEDVAPTTGPTTAP